MSNPGSSRSMLPSEKVPWVGQSQPRELGRTGQPGLLSRDFKSCLFLCRNLSFHFHSLLIKCVFPPMGAKYLLRS